MIPDINDGICSIMISLSTINTITESQAKFDYTPDNAFIINQFHILNDLQRQKVFTEKDHISGLGTVPFLSIRFWNNAFYFLHYVRGNDDKIPI